MVKLRRKMPSMVIACMLAMVMLFSMAVPAFAFGTASVGSVAEDVNGGTIVGQDVDQGKQTEYWDETAVGNSAIKSTADVYATVPESDIVVTVPKVIILDGKSAASNVGTYTVKVQGDISADTVINVVPQDEMDDRDGVNFEMSSAGKNNIPTDVAQEKTSFAYADGVRADAAATTTGTVTAYGMTAGKWNGNFTFNISTGITGSDSSDIFYEIVGSYQTQVPVGLMTGVCIREGQEGFNGSTYDVDDIREWSTNVSKSECSSVYADTPITALINYSDGSTEIVTLDANGGSSSGDLDICNTYLTNLPMSDALEPSADKELEMTITDLDGTEREITLNYMNNDGLEGWSYEGYDGISITILPNFSATIEQDGTNYQISGLDSDTNYAVLSMVDESPDIILGSITIDGQTYKVNDSLTETTPAGEEIDSGKIYYSGNYLEISLTLSKEITEDGTIIDSTNNHYFEYTMTRDLEIESIVLLNKKIGLPKGFFVSFQSEVVTNTENVTRCIYSFADDRQVEVPFTNGEPTQGNYQLELNGIWLKEEHYGYVTNPEKLKYLTIYELIDGEEYGYTYLICNPEEFKELDKYIYPIGESPVDGVVLTINNDGSEAIISINGDSDGIMANLDTDNAQAPSTSFPQLNGSNKNMIKSLTIKEGVTVVKSLDTLTELESMIVADSVVNIQSTCSGCADLVVYGSQGSYAEEWANTNGHTFVAI